MAASPSRACRPGGLDAGALQGLAARQPLALVERLAFAQEQQRQLGHRRQVAARAHGPFLAHDGRHAPVEHLDEGERDLRAAARVAVRVDVGAARHGRAHVLDRRRRADAGRVVVDEIALERLHLLVAQQVLRELADARVGAVHDLARRELLLQHGAAHLDALEGLGRKLHLLSEPGDADQGLDGQMTAVQNDCHEMLLGFLTTRGARVFYWPRAWSRTSPAALARLDAGFSSPPGCTAESGPR